MKVKELIAILSKANPEGNLFIDDPDREGKWTVPLEIEEIIEKKDINHYVSFRLPQAGDVVFTCDLSDIKDND